jgi:hypothetical protein
VSLLMSSEAVYSKAMCPKAMCSEAMCPKAMYSVRATVRRRADGGNGHQSHEYAPHHPARIATKGDPTMTQAPMVRRPIKVAGCLNDR